MTYCTSISDRLISWASFQGAQGQFLAVLGKIDGYKINCIEDYPPPGLKRSRDKVSGIFFKRFSRLSRSALRCGSEVPVAMIKQSVKEISHQNKEVLNPVLFIE